jgi:Protein of unknown function (DUF3224)
MPSSASETFAVKLKPQTADDKAEGTTLGRMSIDKQYSGDLVATGKVEMLTASTNFKGPAGYVATEQVTGTLHGRSGRFVLQHSGTMRRGWPRLTVTVVPDLGAGQLVGLAGKLAMNIAEGKHLRVRVHPCGSPREVT